LTVPSLPFPNKKALVIKYYYIWWYPAVSTKMKQPGLLKARLEGGRRSSHEEISVHLPGATVTQAIP
jgi:hypothetical protein